jgi:hypothetical protein
MINNDNYQLNADSRIGDKHGDSERKVNKAVWIIV